MKKLISLDTAGNILLVSLGLLVTIHIFVLSRFLPPYNDWVELAGIPYYIQPGYIPAGEIIALFMAVLFVITIAAKMNFIKASKFDKAIKFGIWFIFIYMIINTVGNLVLLVIGIEPVWHLIYFLVSLSSALFALRLTMKESLPPNTDSIPRKKTISLINLILAGVASAVCTTIILFVLIFSTASEISTGAGPEILILPFILGIFPGSFIGIIDGVIISLVPLPERFRMAINCLALGALFGMIGIIYEASIQAVLGLTFIGGLYGLLIGVIIWRASDKSKDY